MSDAPDFADKPFEDLTEAELAALDSYDWSAEQILTAISLALRDRQMEAVVQLLHRLALKDPVAAGLITAVIARTAQEARP
jgi:hypothetical protein